MGAIRWSLGLLSLLVAVSVSQPSWAAKKEDPKQREERCARDLRIVGGSDADRREREQADEAAEKAAIERLVEGGPAKERKADDYGVIDEAIYSILDRDGVPVGETHNDGLRAAAKEVLRPGSEGENLLQRTSRAYDDLMDLLGYSERYNLPHDEEQMLHDLGTHQLIARVIERNANTDNAVQLTQMILGALTYQAAAIEMATRIQLRASYYSTALVESGLKSINVKGGFTPLFASKQLQILEQTDKVLQDQNMGLLPLPKGKYSGLDDKQIQIRVLDVMTDPDVPQAYRAVFSRMIFMRDQHALPIPCEVIPFAEALLAAFSKKEYDWVSPQLRLTPAQQASIPPLRLEIQANQYLSRYIRAIPDDPTPEQRPRLYIP